MRSGHSQSGSPPAEAAEMPPALGGRLFRREGEYWTIAYDGTIIRLRDSKGLRYLAYLLGRPGQPVAAGDLMVHGAGGGNDPARAAKPQSDTRDQKPFVDER